MPHKNSKIRKVVEEEEKKEEKEEDLLLEVPLLKQKSSRKAKVIEPLHKAGEYLLVQTEIVDQEGEPAQEYWILKVT